MAVSVGIENKHILVADDEKHTRLVLSLILRKAGFRVTTVCDGLEALNKVVQLARDSDPFDLLVIDVQMPGMTGTELVDELMKQRALFPILLISGYSDKDMVAGLLKDGRIGYLEKPFEPDELLRHVALLIERAARCGKQGILPG